MILSEFVGAAIDKLKQAGIDNPQLDARLLACHALKCGRVDLLSQTQRVLNDDELRSIDTLIARRTHREPVARIIGVRQFWGLEFGLNEATLEPRPDSETVVEAVLSSFQRLARHRAIKILDMGTGTGCLLLALLHEMPEATGIGIDISPRAVEQAMQNAESLGLYDRGKFIVSDWFDEIKNQKLDIIVSNPPYIPASEIPELMPEVRDYDPSLALNGGEDGLAPYRFLIPQLKDFLNPQGIAAFEVGIRQAQLVVDLFRQYGFTHIKIHKDLGGVERCVTAHMS